MSKLGVSCASVSSNVSNSNTQKENLIQSNNKIMHIRTEGVDTCGRIAR